MKYKCKNNHKAAIKNNFPIIFYLNKNMFFKTPKYCLLLVGSVFYFLIQLQTTFILSIFLI